jgi:hypothetical protein
VRWKTKMQAMVGVVSAKPKTPIFTPLFSGHMNLICGRGVVGCFMNWAGNSFV